MDGQLQGLFAGLIFVTVALTALAIGLMTRPEALRRAVRGRNFTLVVVANTLIVPLVGLAVVGPLDLGTSAEAGVLLCAICAAGPIALKASQIARADLTWALAVTVALLFLNIVSLPLWSALLLGRTIGMRPGELVGVLILAIAVPVALGAWYGGRRPDTRLRWSGIATAISNLTLVLAIVVGLLESADALVGALSSGVMAAAAIIVVIAGLIGGAVHDETHRRRASSVATMNRATSIALLVVARVFPGDPVVFTSVIVFGLVQTVLALGVSLYWRWISPGIPAPIAEPGITR